MQNCLPRGQKTTHCAPQPLLPGLTLPHFTHPAIHCVLLFPAQHKELLVITK